MHGITAGLILMVSHEVGLLPSVLLAAVEAGLRIIEDSTAIDMQMPHDIEEDGDRDISMAV